MQPLLLASASPRRREILGMLELSFEAVPAKNEALIDPSLPIDEAVRLVARGKAEEVAASHPERVVIGADTVVAIDGKILGKPKDKTQAHEMLKTLQGRTHEVYTGVWVCSPGGCRGFTDRAEVEFYPMNDEEIDAYIATGEPMDKAGAYGIQGKGMRNIRGIRGDFYTVMGLPGARLWRFLKEMKVY